MAATGVNIPKLKLQAKEVGQQIQLTERRIQDQVKTRDGSLHTESVREEHPIFSQRSISVRSSAHSSLNTKTKTVEELRKEKDMLNRKLYELMNTIQLAEAEIASHKVQDISAAPTREEAARAFFKNRYGTTSQQTYVFSTQVSDLNRTLLPTNRHRRRRNNGTEYAEVAARTIAGQMNR